MRHGVTEHTLHKRFSGGLGGSNPALNDEGRAQVRATADWLTPLAEGIDVVITSPVRRTHESAEILGARLGRTGTEDGLAEMEFGAWDGLTFAEIQERYPDELDAWLGSLDQAPGGGESFRVVEKRVLASLERLLSEYAGRTVLAVSHVTPIKVLVAHALGAPLEAVFRMELAPASVTVLSFFAGRSRVAADVQRPADRRVAHRSLTTTSSRFPRPARPSTPATRGGRRTGSGCPAPCRPRAARARSGPWWPC